MEYTGRNKYIFKPMTFILKTMKFLLRTFTQITNYILNILSYINDYSILYFFEDILPSKSDFLTLTNQRYDVEGRFIEFTLLNTNNYQRKILCKAIYIFLFKNERFLRFGKSKVILIAAFNEECEFNLHPNIYIENDTTFKEYYNTILDRMQYSYYEYPQTNVQGLHIRVWNMDQWTNKDITITRDATKNRLDFKYQNRLDYKWAENSNFKVNKNSNLQKPNRSYYHTDVRLMKPLKQKNVMVNLFSTLDIETIELNEVQVPILITLSFIHRIHRGLLTTEKFLINKNLLDQNVDLALQDLWNRFFTFLDKEYQNEFGTIFVHNLGGFDGYFIYKGLSHFTDTGISTIIDKQNKFIVINYNISKGKKVVFKDSLRIFPASLNELCNIFGVSGKVHEYKKEYNHISILDNQELLKELISYCVIDSQALYKALHRAQLTYLMKYGVDICTIVSTSSLALKIFRKKISRD